MELILLNSFYVEKLFGHESHSGACLICPMTLYGRKIDFPFARRHQRQIASCLVVQPCVYFPIVVLGPCFEQTCMGLLHAAAVSMNLYMLPCCCV